MEGKPVYNGQLLTVSLTATNWGESDASRCVLTDILDNNLEFVAGSVKINGDPAGGLATFDDGTNTLRVNFGAGATVGTAPENGGVVQGTINYGTTDTRKHGEQVIITFQVKLKKASSTADGAEITNQAKVDYDDHTFESYTGGGYTSYSCVEDKINDNGTHGGWDDTIDTSDDSNYINRIYAYESMISGKVFVDNNMDGDIATAGERGVAGVTVTLQLARHPSAPSDLPLSDLNGNTVLTATTDANGNWSFEAIRPGLIVTPVVTIPSNYQATPIKTTVSGIDALDNPTADDTVRPDNKAVTATAAAATLYSVSYPIDDGPSYYAKHAHAGIIPIVEIKKDAYLSSAPTVPLSQSPVAEVPGGSEIIYKITVTNKATNPADILGSADSGAIVISDVLPTGVSYVNHSPTTGTGLTSSYTDATRTVQWTLDTLSPGSHDEFTITVTTGPTPGTIINVPKVTLTAKNEDVTTEPEEVVITGPENKLENLGAIALTVEKKVAGSNADTSKSFTFTITLTDASNAALTGSIAYTGSALTGIAPPTAGTLTLTSGQGTITLKHGQSISLMVPGTTKYTVTEAAASGYTANATLTNEPGSPANTGSASGNTASGQVNAASAIITFTNTYETITPTGAWMNLLPFVWVGLMGICGLVVMASRKRKPKQENGW